MSGAARTGSYDPGRTTISGFRGELERLRAQAELSWSHELPTFEELGITQCSRVADLGCGPGYILDHLKAAMPGREVIGLDADEDLLSEARAAEVPLATGDLRCLPLRDASLDAALLRYVLQHLPEPSDVLVEVRRVLRPGGVAALVDVDAQLWGLSEPTYPEMAPVQAKLARSQAGAGGDRAIGRKLGRLLQRAGFEQIRTRPFAITSEEHDIDEFAAHLGPERLVPLLESGVLSLSEFAVANECWQRFRRDPDAWVMLLGFVVSGVAPERDLAPVPL